MATAEGNRKIARAMTPKKRAERGRKAGAALAARNRAAAAARGVPGEVPPVVAGEGGGVVAFTADLGRPVLSFVAPSAEPDDSHLPPDQRPVHCLTEDEAEGELVRLLSPAHQDLLAVRNMRDVLQNGTAAARVSAAEFLRRMQRERLPGGSRPVLVSFQPAPRAAAGGGRE